MANDRLYLICRLCQDRAVDSDTWAVYLAKYYPSTGYYTNHGAGSSLTPDAYIVLLDRFLDRHHACSLEADGKNWTVGYEADVPLPARYR